MCFYWRTGQPAHHAKRNRLTEAGITDEQFARIHGPVGLNIGAKSPAEIAVSIMDPDRRMQARRLEKAGRPEGGRGVGSARPRSTGRRAPSWRQLACKQGSTLPGPHALGGDVAKLKAAGAESVIAARLDAEDVHGDEAAATVARALAGDGIESPRLSPGVVIASPSMPAWPSSITSASTR